ncbi:hypothetical protein RRG08_045150 [Elysia crispata]|uniref:Uncharacterized protein n=1 Tax=Elysia crispata TaxID=231223 RepID=A0AAE1A4F8_9GAST|nr:hypothetical protein RRG08_045150 [Elysia crispata]
MSVLYLNIVFTLDCFSNVIIVVQCRLNQAVVVTVRLTSAPTLQARLHSKSAVASGLGWVLSLDLTTSSRSDNRLSSGLSSFRTLLARREAAALFRQGKLANHNTEGNFLKLRAEELRFPWSKVDRSAGLHDHRHLQDPDANQRQSRSTVHIADFDFNYALSQKMCTFTTTGWISSVKLDSKQGRLEKGKARDLTKTIITKMPSSPRRDPPGFRGSTRRGEIGREKNNYPSEDNKKSCVMGAIFWLVK